jgi:23S rRNA (guanine745-N1)-methyltransferase
MTAPAERLSYRCPHCRESLVEAEHEFACVTGHHFDRAKEGYVNLLPGGRLKSRPAGDDDSMVRARRSVFDAGLYDPVIDAVAAMVTIAQPSSILDAGCGEGTYLARATAAFPASGWGIDVSKPAVRLAARRHRQNHYAIASCYALPFADAGFDAVINVFSPRDFVEMARVLNTDGVAVVVTPGPRHLAQLKAIIYDDPRQHATPDEAVENASMPEPTQVVPLTFELDLADQHLRLSLLEMTPFWWSTVPERREIIAAHPLAVTVDVRLALYSKAQLGRPGSTPSA